MPVFHLVAYRSTIVAGTANSSLAIIAGAADYVNNQNQYYPQQDMKLLFAAGFGTNITNWRLSTPILRGISTQSIRPFNIATPFGSNFAVAQYERYPIPLKRLNSLDFQATNADAADQAATLIAGLQVLGGQGLPSGERRTVRWTGTTTAVANTWTTVVPTLPESLPDGTYAVCGLQAFGATMYAARVIFQGASNQYRPGVPTVQTIGQRAPYELEFLNGYEWGRFIQSSTPNFEVLCTAGDTAQTFLMDIIKVA